MFITFLITYQLAFNLIIMVVTLISGNDISLKASTEQQTYHPLWPVSENPQTPP